MASLPRSIYKQEKKMSWLYLLVGVLLETGGTVSMKLSEGFTKPLPSVMIFVFYGFAFTALNFAIREIEIGIVYAIWSGVGTAVIATIGIFYFGESVSPIKIISLLLIIFGVIGLNLGGEGVH